MVQQYTNGCVPTAMAMVLSGFGIQASEAELVERYFPAAPDYGLRNEDQINGWLRLIDKQKLNLVVDVFLPFESTHETGLRSRAAWIAPISGVATLQRALQWHATTAEKNLTLELMRLIREKKVGVYVVNLEKARDLVLKRSLLSRERAEAKIIAAFDEFLSKGHIISSHLSLSGHVWVIDSVRTTDEYYYLADPLGRESRYSNLYGKEHLFSLIESGYKHRRVGLGVVPTHYVVGSDVFQVFIRISPREQ